MAIFNFICSILWTFCEGREEIIIDSQHAEIFLLEILQCCVNSVSNSLAVHNVLSLDGMEWFTFSSYFFHYGKKRVLKTTLKHIIYLKENHGVIML